MTKTPPSTQEVKKPLPDTTDPLTAPFWRGTRDQRLTAPRCAACGYLYWPPEVVCPECFHEEFEWVEVPSTGTVWSYAVYHRALDPAFADQIPYVVGLIELSPEVKMYGVIEGDPATVAIGQQVEAVFDAVTEDVTLVRWRQIDTNQP